MFKAIRNIGSMVAQIIPSDNANAVSHEKLVSAEGVSERNYYESYKVMIQGAGKSSNKITSAPAGVSVRKA